ncbi:hypothetical protein BKP64_04655 [Marinobacter salinus]|uniref:PcRGLX/YetA-like N-terminal RIFT barrel domain-containing protein n=1 Tax=Marinobacter salinus TaxID=1874317 RepID=A0A1D9GIT0_9GAMM|nr:hypothetical protein [Marinobacter salinus]AOY87519.1 hypothetical protein BKP64_04655 [Marinobacter salinus]
MEPISITLSDYADLDRKNEPVSLGIPIPSGALKSTSNLLLSGGEDSPPIPFQAKELAHWPDGSIRWLHLSFLATLGANTTKPLRLIAGASPVPEKTVTIEHANDTLFIQTPIGNYAFHPHRLVWDTVIGENPAARTQIFLTDESLQKAEFISTGGWEVVDNGPVSAHIKQEGYWHQNDGTELLRITCELSVYGTRGLTELAVTLHNPRRARHPGGLWDLGDEGSAFFRGLKVETQCPGNGRLIISSGEPKSSNPVKSTLSAGIYQDSSGGEHWDSLNHIDRNGKVTTKFCGFRLSEGGETVSEGLRANPQLTWENEDVRLQVAMPRFWQDFPTSLWGERARWVADLFPEESGQLYELQGGERKRLTVFIDHTKDNGNLDWVYSPLTPSLDACVYDTADAFPWFRAGAPPGPLEKLIRQGIEGQNSFFKKREKIDEYGWRNYGDLFADHETLYQPEGSAPLISHYNNQYDAIYGFARQFALTGDRRWYELMDDLARHVVDIDIYHTDEDRAEYNNGLFWHTDHYLDAHTATHRTFSRHNDTSSTPGQTGGGPAAEHCYTTGLYYHYLMTGEIASRQAVLDLANWMVCTHEGNGGLLEQILALKKQDIPKLRALLKGQRPTRHRYPFTRGTGNYINALLDASLLEPDENWLRRAEEVILATFHPADNIAERNLLDVETGWHYLILLNSLSRYLLIKGESAQYDSRYQYALACFRHYTRWMARNEEPFLNHPEQLEFANHTWAAQDIRKVMLMHQAVYFDPTQKEYYRSKATEWFDYVIKTLQASPERDFSRIQVILLQNHGQYDALPELPETALTTDLIDHLRTKPPTLSIAGLLSRISQRLVRGLRGFRPSRERAWLNARW